MKKKYIAIIAVIIVIGIGVIFGYKILYKMWREDFEKIIAYPAIDEEKAAYKVGDLYGANIYDNGDSITINIYYRLDGGRKYSHTYYYDENGICTSGKVIITASSKLVASWAEDDLKTDNIIRYFNIKREKNIVKADIDISNNKYTKDEYFTTMKNLIEKANWYWVEE